MRLALTLPQPVPECVLRHGQRVLRLAQRPDHPQHYSTRPSVGQRIALYASGEIVPYRAPEHRDPIPTYVALDIPLGLPRHAVVATATIAGYFTAEAERRGAPWKRLDSGPGGRAIVGNTARISSFSHGEVMRSSPIAKSWLDVCDEALSSKWWGLSAADAPIETEDLARRDAYVAGRVRAFGWFLEDVVEIDPPVAATRPVKHPISAIGVWELGRVAALEVALREEQAREASDAG